MSKKIVKTDKEIAGTFEQDEYDISKCIEYYSGIDGATIEVVNHPDHLWSILDRMDTIVGDDTEITEEQKDWLRQWLGRWMNEIEPYCVRLECE
jgi:hypothetical protein